MIITTDQWEQLKIFINSDNKQQILQAIEKIENASNISDNMKISNSIDNKPTILSQHSIALAMKCCVPYIKKHRDLCSLVCVSKYSKDIYQEDVYIAREKLWKCKVCYYIMLAYVHRKTLLTLEQIKVDFSKEAINIDKIALPRGQSYKQVNNTWSTSFKYLNRSTKILHWLVIQKFMRMRFTTPVVVLFSARIAITVSHILMLSHTYINTHMLTQTCMHNFLLFYSRYRDYIICSTLSRALLHYLPRKCVADISRYRYDRAWTCG